MLLFYNEQEVVTGTVLLTPFSKSCQKNRPHDTRLSIWNNNG